MSNKNFSISSQKTSVIFSLRCYVKNSYPCYQAPKKNIKPPRIIEAMRKSVRENSPSQHPIWRVAPRFHAISHQLIDNKRAMNLHRSRAIDAIMECLAAHVNILTNKVYMSLSQISNACGLTTYNSAGKPCYSRASRAINEHLEAIGAVLCDRIWDDTTSSYIPNIIWITELFFVLIGYEYGKYLAAQQQQLAWENKKLHHKGQEPITLIKARQQAKSEHIQHAFNSRVKKQARKKQQRQACKLKAMNKQEARKCILNDLVKLYTKEELREIGYIELNRIVTQRYYAMCKLATVLY